MLLTGFANLFGLGGSSLISRCLGTGDQEKARHCAAFCIWTGAAVALLYGIAVVLLEPLLFPILGASADTWEYCRQYAFWTIGVGAVPTVMNAELAHLIRAEGYSKPAGFGVAFGGILNIVLDPIFIFAFHLDIQGAAIATMLSNLIAMGYFFGFLYHIRKNTVVTPNPKAYSVGEHIPAEVLSVGLPGFVMTLMSTISNAALNHMVAGYSDTAIAGMGIAKKIDLLAYAIAQGMTQGTLPQLYLRQSQADEGGYQNGVCLQLCGRLRRCRSSLDAGGARLPLLYRGRGDGSLQAALFEDHLPCLPDYGGQLHGHHGFPGNRKEGSACLSLLRKGSLNVVFMRVLNGAVGVSGIAWTTPFADWIAFVIALAWIIPYLKRLREDGTDRYDPAGAGRT